MRTQTGEIDDILDFRIALETETAVLAARRHEPADLDVVGEAIASLHDVDGRTAFRQADSQFHLGLARAARSDRLAEAIEACRGDLFSPHDLLPFADPVEETLRDHQEIFDAVAARDADLATRSMREHLDRTRAQLRDIVFGSDGDPAASADVEAPENASAR
jgi:DNA-binding GntR family transcriptional regulator